MKDTTAFPTLDEGDDEEHEANDLDGDDSPEGEISQNDQ